ncbi:MAG: hypothetical protein SOT81_02190 [Treponema sp.]|nr:hypothetical protein [Treponema sp.]
MTLFVFVFCSDSTVILKIAQSRKLRFAFRCFGSAPRKKNTAECQAFAVLQASRLQAGFPGFLNLEAENRATLSPTQFAFVAFCHCFAKPLPARGISPLLRQVDFSAWHFAIASPSRFRRVAFCHAFASLISACGESPPP